MEDDENTGIVTNGEQTELESGTLAEAIHLSDMYQNWFLDYASYVILERAVPEVMDGLKPVQRRILHAMKELDDGRYNKVANIIGHTMKYHPHGDAAVYDSLVRMAQDWNLRYPLIDGQGNFGSIDGDEAAAMRYTEARMASVAEEMLNDIEKQTVDFSPNFDGSLEEPDILPGMMNMEAFGNFLIMFFLPNIDM